VKTLERILATQARAKVGGKSLYHPCWYKLLFFTSSCSRVRSRRLVRRTGADESNPVRLFPIRILQESTKDLTTRL